MRLCAGCRNSHFLLKECLAALTGECRIRSRRTTAAFRQSNRKDRFCQKKHSPEITTHSDFTQHSFLYMLYFKKRKINLFLLRISTTTRNTLCEFLALSRCSPKSVQKRSSLKQTWLLLFCQTFSRYSRKKRCSKSSFLLSLHL